MGLFELFSRWPLIRQFQEKDSTALGETAMSERSRHLEPRTVHASTSVQSIFVTGSHRLYRRPGAMQWERIPLHKALDMVAERVQRTRDATWEAENDTGETLNRTLGIAHLGGATLDNEENYLIKKLFTAGLGIVQMENQARI